MAKRLMILACVVDDRAFYRNKRGSGVTKHDFVTFAADALGEEGCSDFIAWDSAADFVKDHTEAGPINVKYLREG